jgi:hypothetical protein
MFNFHQFIQRFQKHSTILQLTLINGKIYSRKNIFL